VLRNGRSRVFRATLGERRDVLIEARALTERLSGAVLSDIPEASPLHGRIEAVFVAEVEPGSVAWHNGLRPNDVIVSVNRQRVRNLQEMKSVVNKGGRGLVLNIQRGNGSVFILIQ